MAQDFTSTRLLAAIKSRGLIPSTDETFATSDFLDMASEEMQSYVVPLLMSVQEEYLVATKDYTIASGTAGYAIPPRAIGGKLREVLVSSGSDYVRLNRIEPERELDGGLGYKLEGNFIVLLPTPTTAGTLRVRYFRRPSKLIATTACRATTAAYAAATTAITVASTIPSTFTNGALVDVVGASPGFDAANDDRTLSSPSGTSATLASPGLLAATALGDYVCLAGESPIPQIPVELHPLLAQRTAFRVLEALGSPNSDRAGRAAEEMYERAKMLLSPRVEGAPRVIVNRFGPGFGSGRRRRAY